MRVLLPFRSKGEHAVHGLRIQLRDPGYLGVGCAILVLQLDGQFFPLLERHFFYTVASIVLSGDLLGCQEQLVVVQIGLLIHRGGHFALGFHILQHPPDEFAGVGKEVFNQPVIHVVLVYNLSVAEPTIVIQG